MIVIVYFLFCWIGNGYLKYIMFEKYRIIMMFAKYDDIWNEFDYWFVDVERQNCPS